MKTSFTKSTGQGNLFSKLDPKIFENNTCIISSLQSRSLTGRNPQIKVHKHFGDRLQLFWQTRSHEMGITRSIGHDKMIIINDEITIFCKELILGGLENLCTCIAPRFWDPTRGDGRVEICFYSKHSNACLIPNCPLRVTETVIRKRKTTNLGYCLNWK
jgi:hypothetical protein